MSRKIVGLLAVSLTLLGLSLARNVDAAQSLVLASSAASMTRAAPTDGGAGCIAALTAQISGEPFCGTCFGSCSSDAACDGRHAGDLCSNDGGVCHIFNGCGAHDCCVCANAALAAVFSGPGVQESGTK
jgi:hypothetical protein